MSARHRIPELTPRGRAPRPRLCGARSPATVVHVAAHALAVLDRRLELPRRARRRARRRLGRRPAAAAAVAAEYGVPLVARGAATSLAGQAIGPGIAVDCFKLDRILAIDPEARTARVEPGVIQASLNRAAAAYGLEFGPDTSTVDQATIGGMVGNNSSGSRSIVYGETERQGAARRTPCSPAAGSWPSGAAHGARSGERADGAGAGRAGGGARGDPRALSPADRRGLPADAPLHLRLQPARAARAAAEPGAGCWPAPRARWRCSPRSR